MEVTRGMSLCGDYYATEGNLMRLTLGNFDYRNNCFKDDKSKDNLYFSGDVKTEFILNKGDIITPLTEQAIGLLGSTAKVPCSGKYIQSQDVGLIKCNDKLNPDFAYYLIPSKLVRTQLSAAAQQTKIRHTSPDKIKNCTVWIPDYSIQEKIGKLLSALDDKIALNRRMNAKLEQMVKHLYDHWFVQFDFPNADGKPYKASGGKMEYNEVLKRDIPAGWEVVQIQEILDNYPSTKRYMTNEYLSEGKYPIIDQDSTKFIAGFINENCNLLTRFPAIVFGDHSTCLKFVNCSFARGADGTQILYSKDKRVKPYYFFWSLKNLTIPNPGYSRHFKYLKELPIIIPSLEIANAFQEIVKPFYEKKSKCDVETQKLTALRDRLLPLLMNGQVEVR